MIVLQGSDPDGSIVSYDIASQPSHGTVTISNNTATYVPNAGNTLNDQFSFTVTDAEGAISNLATVSINFIMSCTIACPPVAEAKAATTDKNVATVITLSGSDDNGSVVRYELSTQPANGEAVLVDDKVTFTPNTDFTGVDSFTYVAIDNDNVASTPATVTINVNDPIVNKPPVACFTSTVNKQDLTASFDANCATDDTTAGLLASWDFGDANTQTGITTSHSYSTASKFMVTLTVTDNEGLSDSISQEIDLTQTVVDSLTCEIGSIDTWSGGVVMNNIVVTNIGSGVTQDWQASISTSGPIAISNSWNADVATSDDAIVASGNSLNPGQSVAFGFQGSFSGDVSFGECTTNGVAPTNRAPVADFSVNTSNLVVDFDASTSSDADGDALTYRWRIDGVAESGELVSYTFASAGTYTITLTVSDGTFSDTMSKTVTVSDQNSGDSVCSFEVVNDWQSGFNGKIVITNNGNQTMDDWQVSWQFTDGSVTTNAWNANVTLGTLNTATPLSWNGTIAPGASIEFGISGNKGTAGSTVAVPTLTGESCQ